MRGIRRGARRPDREARRPRILGICKGGATQQGGNAPRGNHATHHVSKELVATLTEKSDAQRRAYFTVYTRKSARLRSSPRGVTASMSVTGTIVTSATRRSRRRRRVRSAVPAPKSLWNAPVT